MNSYDTIMQAKTVDDIPLLTTEWMLFHNYVHLFTVIGHRIGNVAKIEFVNGDREYMELNVLQKRVDAA